ncbi:uncharacterized protein [Watersipora subatra]|uniref:uncharacterized protein n=1 Tax=Watersipora subatra TaxID=2589382 RepID=UPI00355BAF42
MPEKLFCFRNRIRLFFTLLCSTALVLFTLNITTQVSDYPPSHADPASGFKQRHLIDKWRKERLLKQNQPLIAPVPCKGGKCDKFMGVLGLDGSDADEPSHQQCDHPMYSLKNDTIAKAFTRLPPLRCNKKSQCGYSDGEIRVADGWSCLLQRITRPAGMDSEVEYDSPLLISHTSSFPGDLSGDFFKLSCTSEKNLMTGQTTSKVERFQQLVTKGMVEEEHFIPRISEYPEEKPTPCATNKCLPYNVFILAKNCGFLF